MEANASIREFAKSLNSVCDSKNNSSDLGAEITASLDKGESELDEFRKSLRPEYEFPPNLNRHEKRKFLAKVRQSKKKRR